MTSRVVKLYDHIVLGRPVITLLLISAIFLYFAPYIRDFKLDASADSLMLENDQDLRIYREVVDRYSAMDFLFVAYIPNGELFGQESLATIRALRDQFRTLEMVASVTSLVDIPLVKQKSGKLSDVTNNYRTLTDRDVDLDKARAEVSNSPLFSDLVVSKDGTTTAMMLTLKEDPHHEELFKRRNALIQKKYTDNLSYTDQQELAQVNEEYFASKNVRDAAIHKVIVQVREIFTRFAGTGKMYVGGVPMISDDMITYIKKDLVLFGSGIFIFLVVMLYILFRQLRWVVLPLATCFTAVLLMIGLLGYTGWRVTVISSNFISLMMILTISMNIYLVVRYRQLCWDYPDMDQRQLVLRTVSLMFWPCLYTALTNMVGFFSLVVSDIRPVIDFGRMMTLGLTLTVLLSFLMMPAILVMLKRSSGHDDEYSRVPFTAWLASLTERYGKSVIVISLLVLAISIFGISRLQVENSFINYFSEKTEIYRSLKLIDERLGGTSTLDIVIRFPKEAQTRDANAGTEAESDDVDALFGNNDADKSAYWFTPEKIELIKAIHDYLQSIPVIGKVRSLASTVRVAEDLQRGQEFDTFEMGIIYKRIPDALRSEMLTPYVSIDKDEARINLRVKDSMKDLHRNALLKQIRFDLENKFHLAPDSVQITGLMVLYNNMLQSLFQSQIMTLGIVMICIALMLLVLFRSVPLAIIGILPNILVAAIALGSMGVAGIPLDIMTITIASITVGIGVDNGIQYIYRFREEFEKQGRDYLKTMHYCHASIGRAVFSTATTIIVGFSILVLSNFIPTITFGVLTAMAMFIALIASLTLLPKLILMWKPFK